MFFSAPANRVVVGPLHGQGAHHCLALRAWNGHFTVSLNEDVALTECTASCVTAVVSAHIRHGIVNLMLGSHMWGYRHL